MLCKQAGVISGIHSCGRERYIVELCAQQSDLEECKQKFGNKLALMGNLHTSNVMLYGSVKYVRRESLKAILVAGEGGGFVLSTGDQCEETRLMKTYLKWSVLQRIWRLSIGQGRNKE